MRITKRILAFVLTLALLLAALPAAALPKAEELPVEQPISIAGKTTMPNMRHPVPALPEDARLPVKSAEPSRMDYTQVDAIFDRIEAAEAASATKNSSQTEKTEAAIQIVMESEGFLEGSLEQNGNVFTWWTDTGIRCIYHPYMRKQAKDFADKGEDIVLNEPLASRSDAPTGSDVYLIGPYYGYDSDFTDQYKTEAKRIAHSIGDTDGYTLYGGSAATVDTVAKAVSNGAVVIFDSHGGTDYENPYNEDDFISGANYSYLCLKSSSGLTTEDYNDGAAYGGSTTYINGAVIANHMTKQSPSGIVWMAICLGMATDTLQAPLRQMGVEVVYGYSQSVTFIGDYVFEYTFWTEMCQDKTVAESIATMKNKWGSWDLSTQIMSYYGYSGGHASAAAARNAYDAFPIVVSDDDPYPGRRTSYSYGVDAPQTVKSTYHLVSQSGGSSTTLGGNCGYNGDNLTWTLSESGVLTISGEGYMADYHNLESIPWYPYRDRIVSIVVKEGAWDIGKAAFYECKNVTSVSLPGTLNSAIGDYAFTCCASLTSITIPQNVTSIGEEAFYLCENLKSITIPAKITEIGAEAFVGCYALKSVTLPEGLLHIGDRAFQWCSSLTSVVIPASVETIGNHCFLCCENLTAITVKSGNAAYANDSRGVLFDKSKTRLIQAPGALTGAYTIPSTVTALTSGAFCKCDALTEVKIPASVKEIDAFTFESCNQLIAIRVDSGNAYFVSDAAGALYNKDKTFLLQAPGAAIGLFVVPSGVQEIAYGAFYDCAEMSSVFIPKTTTTIFNYAFDRCDSLTDVYYEGSTTLWQSISFGTFNDYLLNANIHYDYHVSGEEDETVSILSQPVSVTVEEGQTAFFSVTASGTGVTYGWQYSTDGGASWYNCSSTTQGYNASTLIVEGTLARNGFLYRCKVTDSSGNVRYSDAAALTVQAQPVQILQQPKSVTVTEGEKAVFSVKAEGADLQYQWQYSTDGGASWYNCSSATQGYNASTLSVEGTLARNGFLYRCKVTDGNGNSCYSNAASLTVQKQPFAFLQHPQNVTAQPGDTVSFSVKTNYADVTYRWVFQTKEDTTWMYWSTSNDPSQISCYVYEGMDGYRFRCIATYNGKTYWSNTAVLTVASPSVQITSQPKDQAVTEGESAVFTIAASGTGLSYQWQYSKDGGTSWNNSSSTTVGYNTPKLTVEGTLARNGFRYRCKLTDSSGNVLYSNAAKLTVEKHPIQLTAQPKDQTVAEGKQAVFTVAATGTGLSYQWQYSANGGTSWNNSSSATVGYNTSKLTVVATLTRDGFLYRCKLTDSSGNVRYSDAAALTVKAQPVQITQQPKSVTVTEGEKAVFSVKAEGADLQYQWQYSKDGGNLWTNSSSAFPGYNTATLTVEGTLARNGFLYRCKVTGSATTLYSQAVTLTVKAYPIQITAQPSNKSITEGSNAVFSVAATGTDLTYQWQYSKDSGASWYGCSSSFSGYNTPKLTVEGTLARNGFLYRCKLTDSSGNVLYSKGATLTVKEHPIQITSQPVSKAVTEDENAVFSVTATGEGLSYRWQYMQPGSTAWTASSSATAGYNTAKLTVVGTLARNGFQYRCQIKDANGNSCYTNAVTLTVKEKPIRITSQPVSKTVEEGENAVFSVTATGEGLSYRWQYKQPGSTAWTASSSATAGYNTATLTVVGTLARNGFQYRCQIKDAAGNVAYSEAATLNVLEAAIKITGQPKNATVEEDANARFTVEATGKNLTYMWQYKKSASGNWTNCTAATAGYNTAMLTVVGTLARNGFQYRCRMVDAAGNIAYSEAAALTVHKRALGFTQQPESAIAKLGNYAEFAVAAEGTDLTYRWQYSMSGTGWINTTVFTSGYNTATLRVLAEEKRDGFRYRCVVTDGKGNKIYSQAAMLTVDLPAQSVFVSQPTDQYRMAGRKAYFEVKLQGSIASIQWQYQTAPGTAWYDSSSATLGYNTQKLSVNGDVKRNGFAYRCVVTDAQGYIHVSQVATLTITKAQINSNPTDAAVSAGAAQVFRVTVSGAYSQVYWQYSKDGGKSWYASSSSFPGYNTTAMTVTATAGRNGFLYRCVLVDIDGTKIYSAPALLTVK